MAKKKKVSNITRIDQFQKKKPFDQLKQEMRELLNDGHPPYDVFCSGISERLDWLYEKKKDQNLADFLDQYPLEGLKLYIDEEDINLTNAYFSVDNLLKMYYLLRTEAGNFEYNDIVEWLPVQNPRQKEVLKVWPEACVFSIFQVELNDTEQKVYFKDVRTGKLYLSLENYRNVKKNYRDVKMLSFASILLKLEGYYQPCPPFSVELTDYIQTTMQKTSDQKDWEKTLLEWLYALLGALAGEDDLFSEIEENYDLEFFPLIREEETDQQFAHRLLQQHQKLSSFPGAEKVEELLTKFFQTFPALLLPRVNGITLLEGIEDLILIDDDTEDDDFVLGDDLSHFWYLMFVEYFPEEVEALKQYQVAEDEWYDV